MTVADVAAVAELESRSFVTGWSSTAFQRELTQNGMARYLVLEGETGLIGFAGLWLMVDEAHVVTVAVAPENRRNGYGRLLVHGLIELARGHSMPVLTLECRVSNEPARSLYRTYGFYEVGTRKAYYSDNREDAVIMTTEDIGSPAYRTRFEQLEHRMREIFPGVQPYTEAVAG
jgi:[ribosomal protein S18]-alanine N-acetyltransferase